MTFPKVPSELYYVFGLAILSLTISLITIILTTCLESKKQTEHTYPGMLVSETTKKPQEKNIQQSGQQQREPTKLKAPKINPDAAIAQVGLSAPWGTNKKLDFSNSHPVTSPVIFNLTDPLQFAHGVGFKNNGIILLKSAFFFVYVSARFSINDNISCSDHYNFFLYVIKIPPDDVEETETIMRLIHTCVDGSTQGGVTKFSGRGIHLNAGDIIQVRLSGKGFIDHSQTFLGLFTWS